jgi:hypothetical protein
LWGFIDKSTNPRRRTRALEHIGDEMNFFALRVYRRQDGDDRFQYTQEDPQENVTALTNKLNKFPPIR